MFVYTFNEWLIFFYFYCFLGWCFESTYVSLRSKALINRGFMKGPWLPIYGSGAIITILSADIAGNNIARIYVIGAFLATLLELITGEAMVRLFKVRYWDYSSHLVEYKGHICMSSTIAWGFLSIIMVFLIQPRVERIIFSINTDVLSLLTFLTTALMSYDFANALRKALDLKKLLVQLEKAKLEFTERLDEKRDIIEEHISEYKEELKERIVEKRILTDERKKQLESRIKLLEIQIEEKISNVRHHNPGYKIVELRKRLKAKI